MWVWAFDIIAIKYPNKARQCFYDEAISSYIDYENWPRLLLDNFVLQFDDVD
jgi:hypothetical protein